MKKLFALVLTLALVFAIAAPAMAASWGAPTATTGVPYATTVTLLQQNTDAAGNKYYTAYPANLGVVAGTTVFFSVDFTVPTAAEVAAYYGSIDPSEAALVAKITYKNLKSVAEVTTPTGDPDGIVSITDGAITVDKSKLVYTDDQNTYTAIFTAVVTKTAEASITSTYGYGAATTVASFTNIVKKVDNVSYTITTSGISSTAGTLTLTLGTGSVVTGMTLTIPSDRTYTVAAGPVFQYVSAPDTISTLATTDAKYAAVLAAYNALTGVLGFKAGDAGVYYTAANIVANFSVKNAATDTETYKPYTSSLTVSDSTTVPNTGDAVSVLGFVMVGLALLATAAVVVKKVRA